MTLGRWFGPGRSTAGGACRSSACSPPRRWRACCCSRSALDGGLVCRHGALGRRHLARLPRRHERRRGRPGARGVAGQRRLVHRLLRVPRRAAADRLPRGTRRPCCTPSPPSSRCSSSPHSSPATCGRCGPPNPEPTKHVFAPSPRDLRSYRGGAARLLRAHRPVVRRHLPRGPNAGAGRGLAGHRARRERPHPGANRLRQDARGVPARHRPARHHARRRHRHPAALRLAAEGPELRRRAQPARPARRHPRDRGAPRPARARHLGRRPHRRHARARPAPPPCAARRT